MAQPTTEIVTFNFKNIMITPSDFTRINNDVNGNPRYVCHFLTIPLSKLELSIIEDKITIAKSLGRNTIGMNIDLEYAKAIEKAKKIGGKKYHTKNFGGGIVFQSYNIQSTCDSINNL